MYVLIFFAVFGWEAIAQLSAEFRDPERDVPRSTLLSVGLIMLLCLVFPFAGAFVGLPVAVAAVAWLYRRLRL
jgi:amino acid efflux transporter